ncbi:Uncharacterised protein [Vibrio cholerae]|uniref:Uncharacterized protein n=1 Tax=Vibrio cholerae TaxID=666 RepID=A0A656A7U4_VIBCL|nr:Uncharacterised protein [Vibrio cholerae]CSA09753.1 Uncharacterised protein [Vibrio cholerae]CSB39815.1 Uncharacterised protein [Vibrio cholerae]CSB48035.1 Uncharacterised protein [Vibrio cholerae]CSB49656.1 Uncharacterised protein [Vibrio cholerae]
MSPKRRNLAAADSISTLAWKALRVKKTPTSYNRFSNSYGIIRLSAWQHA